MFPTEHGIATVRDDQMDSRACYLNFFEPHTVNIIISDIDKANLNVKIVEAPEEGCPLNELDHQIIESEPNVTLMEELKTLPINS